MAGTASAHVDTPALRADIIETARVMNRAGLNHGSSGNISVRVRDGILITPSAVAYDAMCPGMLVKLPLKGTPRAEGAKPSSEWPFHQALLAARSDLSVIIHAHPVHCMALAMNRMRLPACHYMVAAFGGDSVELAAYALFGSDALADHVVAAMEDRYGCLMANHGALCAGESLTEAMWRLQELEVLAQSYLLARAAGTPVILSEAEMEEALAAFGRYRA